MTRWKIAQIFVALSAVASCVLFTIAAVTGDSDELRLPASVSKAYDKYLRYVPDAKLRSSIRDYLEEVSNIHSGANVSIEKSNQQKLDANSCLAELSTRFYLDLQKNDWLRLKDQMSRGERPLGARLALDEEAGVGFWKDKKPGFLWDEIMTWTDGNANLAVEIIKMCGHDDAISEKPQLKETHSAYASLKAQQIRNLDYIERNWANAPPFLSEIFDGYRKNSGLSFMCVNNSALFLPKALGKDVSISDRTRDKIIHLQAPNKGGAALPAKNYHVIAGVAVGCKFKQGTGYSFIGSNIARQGARFYRAKTLRLNTSDASDRETWDAYKEEDFSDAKLSQLQKQYIGKSAGPSVPGINLLSPLARDKVAQMTPEHLRNHVIGQLAKIDAAILWKKWYTKTSIPGIGEVFLPNRSRRPEFDATDRHSSGLTASLGMKNSDACGEEWSPQRCANAIRVMDTWEVDFEWSQEAQWNGARFGEKNCTRLKSPDEIEKSACQALQNLKRKTGRAPPVSTNSGAR